jgi:hypothetical protein
MPVEADKLVVINAALVLIGDDKIESLSDTGEREDLANDIYELRVEEALGMARWRFATRQVQLALNLTAPLARWDAAYDLPDGGSDPEPLAIHAVTVNACTIPFDRYENQIYCNAQAADEVMLDYSHRALEADWMGRFKGAFIDQLAADFALSKDQELHDRLLRRSQAKFKIAASLESQERTSRKLPVHHFTKIRRSGYSAGLSTGGVGGGGGGGGGPIVATVSDGDKGDITITNGVWNIDAGVINTTELADDGVTLDKFAHGTSGDILYYGASGVPLLLPKANDTDVLQLVAGLPSWVNIGSAFLADNSVTMAKMAHGTAGDTIIMDASAVPTLLAAGVADEVLTMVGGIPSWAAVPAAMEFFDSGDFGVSSAVNIINIGGYSALIILLQGVTTSVSCALELRTSINNGSTYASGASDYTYYYLTDGGDGGANQSSIQISQTMTQFDVMVFITGFNKSIAETTLWAKSGNPASPASNVTFYSGNRSATEANDALRIFPNAGNFTAGRALIWGLRE